VVGYNVFAATVSAMPMKIPPLSMAHSPTARRSSRGFTLIELMAVVVITSILALAGVSLFRQQLVASKGTEAVSVIQAIRAGEEAYAAENHVYFDVSTASGGALWYPNTTPSTTRYAWVQPSHLDYPRWRELAPSVNRPVIFGYLVNAGEAGTNVPPLQLKTQPAFPAPMVLGWYVIQARGDANGDRIFATYAASSMNGELSIENEGE
jgi:prepilin-type N-terminal cleavage/methylation domain-containing protein